MSGELPLPELRTLLVAAYCAATGQTPDAITGPPATAKYLRWIRERWAEFARIRPELFNARGAKAEAAEPFALWLAEHGPKSDADAIVRRFSTPPSNNRASRMTPIGDVLRRT